MELSEQDLRELQAARAFGEARNRVWMHATFVCCVIAFAITIILLWYGVITLVAMDGIVREWVIGAPTAVGFLGGLGFKRWYTPILARKIAERYRVPVESLELATIDITGG